MEALEYATQQDKWHTQPGRYFAVLATRQRLSTLKRPSQVIEAPRCLFEEPIARGCGPYSSLISFEEVRADTMFKVSNASAYRRLLKV